VSIIAEDTNYVHAMLVTEYGLRKVERYDREVSFTR